jgi:hypothetical protein
MTIKAKTRRIRAARYAVAHEGAPSLVPDLQAISTERATGRGSAGGKHAARHIREYKGGRGLTDSHIDAMIDMAEGAAVFMYDMGGPRSVPGLRLRLGPRSATWLYFHETVDHRKATDKNRRGRKVTSKTLGRYDRGVPSGDTQIRADWHMSTDEARTDALKIAGTVASGRGPAGKRTAITFAEAFAEYLDYLQDKAGDKPARWRGNVRNLGANHMLPEWGGYSLADMSASRKQVGAWYNKIARTSVTTGHHCRRIIRAIYNRQRELGETLPPENPALAKITRKENWQTDRDKPALAFDQFPAWLASWRNLAPLHRAYHATAILCGARPGELSRTMWRDLDTRARTLTIGDAKSGADIIIPLSATIARALRLARPFADKSGLIFPGSEQWGHRDELPARGQPPRIVRGLARPFRR